VSNETDQTAAVRVTLDHNCLIDLEERANDWLSLRALISLHSQGVCRLQVAGIGASEMKRDGTYAVNFAEFVEKMAASGLESADILKPLAYLDITYLDWCVVAGDDPIDLEKRIHMVLFPDIEFEYASYCINRARDVAGPIDRKWKNAKCDVLTMWCHIWYGGGIFVTSDRNFHRDTKKPQLIALGAGNILRPVAAARVLQPISVADSVEVR
jgi:hypothetical protein